MISKDDIVERFMRIAFADMTDFVEFGRVKVPVMTMMGPIEVLNEKTGKKEVLTKEVNDVRFKDSSQVDGGLICQIKQGKDGASLKLEDRQRALEWLAAYFEMDPMSKHKKLFDNKKLALEERALDNKLKAGEGIADAIAQTKQQLDEALQKFMTPVQDRSMEDIEDDD